MKTWGCTGVLQDTDFTVSHWNLLTELTLFSCNLKQMQFELNVQTYADDAALWVKGDGWMFECQWTSMTGVWDVSGCSACFQLETVVVFDSLSDRRSVQGPQGFQGHTVMCLRHLPTCDLWPQLHAHWVVLLKENQACFSGLCDHFLLDYEKIYLVTLQSFRNQTAAVLSAVLSWFLFCWWNKTLFRGIWLFPDFGYRE